MAIVTLRGVEKRYGDVRAMDGIDLEVPEGSVFGLIGPNGAGKTTSMLVISTLLSRDAGQVEVVGVDPEFNPTAVRKVLGYMPDSFGFYDNLSAAEYLDFFAAANRVPAAKRPALIADLLALVDLEQKAATDVNTLSRGMKQRLSLARALLHDPQLLVLDEPASGLDPRARVHLRELIAELSRMGKSVIISSHILSELEGICTHLAVIDDGKVKAQGNLDEIRRTLTATRRVSLRAPDEEVDEVAALLAGRPEVSEVDVERGRVRFVLTGEETDSARLLGLVIGSGKQVFDWRLEVAGLEELFLSITAEDAP
ncbi:MAG TPA: ABC transporter ATP-binding protein [Acidimicrobiia bacterium]|jgi:ABC-2 type transport system ATP-binding protein|nr:ABC transporter ATP-binding protein [Acidimicrobiia bacterium]